MTMGKSFETAGRWSAGSSHPDELGDLYDLAPKTYVNGELRQDGNTGR